MLLPRALTKTIQDKLQTSNKAIILYGPRQVGKTTLVNELIKTSSGKPLIITTDEERYIDVLSSRDLRQLKDLVAGYDLLFIDEAQRVPDIGLTLKLFVDHIPTTKVIATGSSSFDLANKIEEPMTGRVWTYTLYPLSFYELKDLHNTFELQSMLDDRLIYGSYPEVFTILNAQTRREYLINLSTSYLYKDILELAEIKHSRRIRDLLKLLAYQIGSEVSLNELGNSLDMSKDTVSRYIDLLEKNFVIFRLKGFNRNLRKEISKMDKIYFYDLGVRNVIVDNMKQLKDRNDQGQLFENFLVIERLKLLSYTQTLGSMYFWRTYTGAELDYIEEREGNLYGYEFKYMNKQVSAPKTWEQTYPNAHFKQVNSQDFVPFTTMI